MSAAIVQSRWLSPGVRPRPQAGTVTSAAWLSVRAGRLRAGALLTRLPVLEGAERAVQLAAPAVVDEHLLVDVHDTAPPELPVADVVVRRSRTARSAGPDPGAAGSAGCLVEAVIDAGDSCVVRTRDGWSAELIGWPSELFGWPAALAGWPVEPVEWPAGSGADWPFAWHASLIHTWLVAGRRLDALDGARVTVTLLEAAAPVGRRSHRLRVLDSSRPAAD